MNFSMKRARTIARREYLTTIKRRAFLFTVIFIPIYFSFIMTFTSKMAMDEAKRTMKETTSVGVVDSSGMFAMAPSELHTETETSGGPKLMGSSPEIASLVTTGVKSYPDFAAGEQALRAKDIRQLLVVPPDFVQTGRLRRYLIKQSVFGGASDRLYGRWVSTGLLSGRVDSLTSERISRPLNGMQSFTLDRITDSFLLYDDRKELFTLFIPIAIAGLLATSILIGGQYLLQGVSEERESRILESLLCTVSTDDIMVGKLIGLGGAGLTMVGVWTVAGLYLAGPQMALAQVHLPPALFLFGFVYFLLGYLLYASIMTAIGAITTNLREANQYAMLFTFSIMIPVILMWAIVGRPEGQLATALSLIPFTAPTATVMRLGTGYPIPAWQLATSVGLLALTAFLTMKAGSKVFRIGLLLYGKTPNLPEIMKWVSSKD